MAGDRGLSEAGLARLDEVMAGHSARGDVPGLAWLVARGATVHVGVAGTADLATPVARDTIFRISSMTKPVVAVAALLLVDQRVIRLDDPVDSLLPELADRQVMRDANGSITDTVPADRAITVRDLLTFRMGIGMDFAAPWPQPSLEAMAGLGLGSGPPAPAGPPPPDEWMRRLGTLPLAHQPGTRWMYHTSAEVLGVLVARVAGQPLELFLRERIFTPLGMRDTGFSVPPEDLARFGACYVNDPETGTRQVYDPVDGQWSRPPAFPGGGDGLVSTLDDYAAFATMLRAGGVHGGHRLLASPTIEAMTTNQLDADQLDTAGPSPDGSQGWGFGVGVQLRRTDANRPVGTYGWDGGLGSSWANDPAGDLTGVLLTNQMWNSPAPPAVCTDFWTGAYAAIDR